MRRGVSALALALVAVAASAAIVLASTTNHALVSAGASWSQSGGNCWSAGGATCPSGAIDANGTTYFRSDTNSVASMAATIDLGQARTIDRLVLTQLDGRHATAYLVLSSTDGTNFTQRANPTAQTAVSDVTFSAVTARYWRIDPTTGGSSTWQVYSAELIETIPDPTPTPEATPTPAPVAFDGNVTVLGWSEDVQAMLDVPFMVALAFGVVVIVLLTALTLTMLTRRGT